MTDFIRRLVSGDKARFKDGDLDVDLDLVYITDQVVVMGYPAAGLESLYRNRREDARRFLEHRHQKNFWVFNFCPVGENSYPASVFDGRYNGGETPAYPLTTGALTHRAPPLAILPLVAREMRTWLEADPVHVAVLHCKAGKGRSGTMACAYLLTSNAPPQPLQPTRSRTAKEEATARAEQIMDAMPSDEGEDQNLHQDDLSLDGKDPIASELASGTETPSPQAQEQPTDAQSRDITHGTAADNLTQVLELHSSRRMKRPSSPSRKAKQGVSIPSQRRWLYYWSLLLAHQAPRGLWAADADAALPGRRKVRLTQITVRMRELSGMATRLVRAANAVIERTSFAKATGTAAASARGRGLLWASLARYDDELVEQLERWEQYTRERAGDMGRRRAGSERRGDKALADIFRADEWDNGKMVRSFARLGVVGADSVRNEESQTDERVLAQVLHPLTDDKWGALRDKIQQDAGNRLDAAQDTKSEQTSINEGAQTPKNSDGVVLEADREVRVKLYMGQVPMGWFWFIPAFHMPRPGSAAGPSATLALQRKEVDFPIGIGSNIIDVAVSMEWVLEGAQALEPPSREGSLASRQGRGEPAGIASSLHAATAGDFRRVVESKQAAED
ncbi:uncharacterized protein FIBRA_06929 [Fibroporia radiculosa]|uniref:phosphatidylinositol-3,4,5-trisphosphate 3-phosphatase n=1 Tax=Fibroporia radiculosa TaxID=599839 RepID=J4GTW6_9APHY|nr:uncharacterized protein FIBRA_06929 [Fibroporia radiculosa]CCM04740.1 predicted protein [Fibroporia radiculosa]